MNPTAARARRGGGGQVKMPRLSPQRVLQSIFCRSIMGLPVRHLVVLVELKGILAHNPFWKMQHPTIAALFTYAVLECRFTRF